MEKIKKIPSYTSTKTIHQVWFVTLLGCLAGIVMAMLVRWAIVDIRDVREAHFVLKGRVNAVVSTFGQRMAEDKLLLHQMLKEAGAPHLSGTVRNDDVADLQATVKSLERLAGVPELQGNFSNVQGEIRKFLALEADCRSWSERNANTRASLAALRKEAAISIQKIHEEIDRAYGQQRLAKALRLRLFEQSAGADSLGVAQQIVDGERQTDVSILLREVSDLDLLVEKIRGETNSDYLADLKDNRLRTSLVRLRRSALLLPESVKLDKGRVPVRLDALERTLFGQGYAMDSKHQTVTLGLGGFYNAALTRLRLIEERDALSREIDARADELSSGLQGLRDLVEATVDREGQGVENTLRRTWFTIVLIIVITGSLFIAASSRIIKAIKKQVRAVEDANLVLDSRTKALLLSQHELNESRMRLQYLSSNLLNAQESERKRIARELHDELGASMAVLKMQVRSAEKSLGSDAPAILHAECDKIRESINQIIENVRRLSRDLSPVVLEDLGLEAAVELLVDNFSELNAVRVSVDLRDIHYLVKEEVQRNVYRILQELLNNIRKHAAATTVGIVVRKIGQAVKFMVEDNGVGFDVDEIHRREEDKGMGLTTIAERVRILGGVLTIDSGPGRGCLVEFTTPM